MMELRVAEAGRPDEEEEWAKETRTLPFLLLTRWRRRPIKACWARRSLETGGLTGFLAASWVC